MGEYREGALYRARTQRGGDVTLYRRKRASGQLAWFDITNARYVQDEDVLETRELVTIDIELNKRPPTSTQL